MINLFNRVDYQARKLVVKKLGVKSFLMLSDEDLQHLIKIAKRNILKDRLSKKGGRLCMI